MQIRPRTDREIRLYGAALLAVAILLLALLHPHRSVRIGDGPTLFECGMALIAVSAGSVGAACLFVGRLLFEPVQDPRRRPPR